MLARVGKQRQISESNCSCRPRATVEREDREIVRIAVIAPDSSLSTIHRLACTHVSNTTLEKVEFVLSATVVTLTSHACTPSSPIIVVLFPIKEELC